MYEIYYQLKGPRAVCVKTGKQAGFTFCLRFICIYLQGYLWQLAKVTRNKVVILNETRR